MCMHVYGHSSTIYAGMSLYPTPHMYMLEREGLVVVKCVTFIVAVN